jgi:hypothetical protein
MCLQIKLFHLEYSLAKITHMDIPTAKVVAIDIAAAYMSTLCKIVIFEP